ncbi:MAG TPA: amino acid permease, partial [Coxiellaceae bacterium]|nr:amino acid permease [Coxiellaceae bacterium]
MSFRRSIGPIGLLFCAIGGIIGSGWLLGPFFAAQIAGPAAVLSWAIGGVMMIIIALTYAELGAMLPIAGGTVRYLQFSHGTLASFTIGWVAWLAAAAVAPIETLALLHYSTNYLPNLMHEVNGVSLLTGTGIAAAAVLMFIMCVLNILGVKLLTQANNLVVSLKLLVPILTLSLLLIVDFHPVNFTAHGFAPMGLQGVLAALPSAGVIFSFIGYNPAIQMAAEAKNPQRDVPFAILGALILCIILYVLLQIA